MGGGRERGRGKRRFGNEMQIVGLPQGRQCHDKIVLSTPVK